MSDIFYLIFIVPVNNFLVCLDGSSWVEPVLSKALWLAQGHNTEMPVRPFVSEILFELGSISNNPSLYFQGFTVFNIMNLFCLFVWFDSLRHINNLSVMRDRSSWVEPVLS